MTDLISRADAIEAFGLSEKTRKYGGDHSGYDTMLKYEIQDVLENLPSADAVQGEWVEKGEYAECSICGAHSGTQFDGVEPIPLKTKFCPCCGARMKGGVE